MMVTSVSQQCNAQHVERNYDESKVGTFVLPDPLAGVATSGKKGIRNWRKKRAYWLNEYMEHMYGVTPGQKVRLTYQVVEINPSALQNRAIRKRVNIRFTDYPQLAPIELLLYCPKSIKPVPVFVSLNFVGNHGCTNETDIPISERWMLGWVDKTNTLIVNNRATEKARGLQLRRWPLDTILARGYAVATAYYGDVEPDFPAGWKQGIRSVLGDTTRDNNWGAIGAWAWQMSRMLDYLETDKLVDASKAIALGHSRLGKAALWAGAQDERFAMVISNDSGEGGAALTRRNYGENQSDISMVPYWYCANYARFNNRVNELPFDQHVLLSLMAPRYLYVASASEDTWADPRGEFLSAVHAQPVYALFGKRGLGTAEWPRANSPIHGDAIGYHLREGKHDVLLYDWLRFMDFADRSFGKVRLDSSP